jgi:N-acetyl-anhydromuramyl-L-alanine amidase AmpD
MPIQPKGIVIHSMAQWLKMPDGPLYARDFLDSINLSVHGFITPEGQYQKMVETPGKAFHAGKSLHEGLSGLNSHYLGFELLLEGEHDYKSFSEGIERPGAYCQEQVDKAVEVCRWWMKEYNIPASRVVRHSDVSGDDVRGKGKGKIDPGFALDWEKFQAALVA